MEAHIVQGGDFLIDCFVRRRRRIDVDDGDFKDIKSKIGGSVGIPSLSRKRRKTYLDEDSEEDIKETLKDYLKFQQKQEAEKV